jgi:predicted outer membrane repeat protein
MTRPSLLALTCALLLATAASQAAFVSIVNLDTYAGGVPTAEDMAGVTIPPGGVARIGVVIELLDGTNWETGLSEPNTLASCWFSFGKSPSSPAGAVRLVNLTGTAVNDLGLPWDRAYGFPLAEWLGGRAYQSAPAIEDLGFSTRDLPPAGASVPIGNSAGGVSTIVAAELVLRGNGVPTLYELTMDVPSSGLEDLGGKRYYYASSDIYGHGRPSSTYGGTWIARNTLSAATRFVIEITDDVLDCDDNGIPDGEETDRADCDQNGILDDCDVAVGFANDCNGNGRPDLCDIEENALLDCDYDDQLDLCQPGYVDCDSNGVHDACDAAGNPLIDCDDDGVPDVCQGWISDCDGDGIDDACGIAALPYEDCNDDGILDRCQPPPCSEFCDLPADLRLGTDGMSLALRHVALHGDLIVACAESAVFVFQHTGGAWHQVYEYAVPLTYRNQVRYATAAILDDTIFVRLQTFSACQPEAEPYCGVIVRLRPTETGWEAESFPAPVSRQVIGLPSTAFRPPHSFVALTDDLLLVGQPGATVNGYVSAGVVELLRLTEGAWQVEATIESPTPQAAEAFGTIVELDGNTLLVTAPGNDEGCGEAGSCNLGAAYLFVNTGEAFVYDTILVPGSPVVGAKAGERAAIRGDTAVLAAPAGNSAFVFRRIANQWRFDGTLQEPVTYRNFGDFGVSVAILDDAVLLGKPTEDGAILEAGVVYLYRRSGPFSRAWRVETELSTNLPGSDLRFGMAAAVDGDRLAVISHQRGYYPWSPPGPGVYVFDHLTDICSPDALGGFCRVSNGRPHDCNDNGVPDGCDVIFDELADCDNDGVPDSCEVDCDGNGIPDECELAENPSLDENQDGVPDACSVVFVRADATFDGHGMSWDQARTTIRGALEQVSRDPATIREVWVAGGVYKPSYMEGTLAVAGTIFVPSGVRLLGGFAGWETSADQRDPAANLTILTGDRLGDDALPFFNRADNYRHVITMEGADDTTLISGFTIRGGEAVSSGFSLGGGMYLIQSSPVIANCVFESNRALEGGGAVYSLGGSPRFVNCRFIANRASGPGGAGGAAATEGGAADFFGSVFHGNRAEHGGAVHADGGSLALTNCTLAYNTATALGGGVFAVAALEIRNSILWANTAGGVADEAAQINHDGGPLTVSHSIVQGWGGELEGVGTFAADPLFVDADGADGVIGSADDDLRPSVYSPAINAGDTAALPADHADVDDDGDVAEAIPLDAAGAARVFGECPVDIGAYEHLAPQPADVYGDCDVGLDDYEVFAACLNLSGPGRTPFFVLCRMAFDTDADSDVDLQDFTRWQPAMGRP